MTFPADPYLVAMGDSMTLGREDQDPVGAGWVGWVTRLADQLEIPLHRIVNTATEGATVKHLADVQLPLLTETAPGIIAFSCGMNDAIHGYRPDDAARSFEMIFRWASGVGAVTLTTELLPPCWSKLRVSRVRRTRLEQDICRLNEQLGRIAAAYGALCLDPKELPGSDSPLMWADNGVHLSTAGHVALAKGMARMAVAQMPLDVMWGIKPGLGPGSAADVAR